MCLANEEAWSVGFAQPAVSGLTEPDNASIASRSVADWPNSHPGGLLRATITDLTLETVTVAGRGRMGVWASAVCPGRTCRRAHGASFGRGGWRGQSTRAASHQALTGKRKSSSTRNAAIGSPGRGRRIAVEVKAKASTIRVRPVFGRSAAVPDGVYQRSSDASVPLRNRRRRRARGAPVGGI